jgi:hypothetical protein
MDQNWVKEECQVRNEEGVEEEAEKYELSLM